MARGMHDRADLRKTQTLLRVAAALHGARAEHDLARIDLPQQTSKLAHALAQLARRSEQGATTADQGAAREGARTVGCESRVAKHDAHVALVNFQAVGKDAAEGGALTLAL